uniref:Ig-like domain-containing protein n=1 Tax=Gopherus agassizii TaxID=38772 RepID=A0A452GIQ0_9SAUR
PAISPPQAMLLLPHWQHSLAVLVTAVTHEEGTYHFTMTAQLDDVQIAYYSSDAREVRPSQEWVAQALDAEYLQEKTQQFWSAWSELSPSLAGMHTEQLHKTCVLSNRIRVAPIYQYAYDGRDFISFDTQTGTWVAAVQPAFAQKRRWETGKTHIQYCKWVQTRSHTWFHFWPVSHMLCLSPVPPMLSVSRRDNPDGFTTLSCHARGFYLRPIHVSWVQDREDILAETDSSGILPNDIHSYYTQSSLEISPQQEDGHRYACQVEHSSLPEPTLVWAPGKKGPLPPGVLAAIVLAVLVVAGAVGAGVVLWRRKSAGKRRSPWSRDVGMSGEWGSPVSPRGNGSSLSTPKERWGRAMGQG